MHLPLCPPVCRPASAATRTGAAPAADSTPGPPVAEGREAAREAAERELSRPVYSEDDPDPVRRALGWLADRLFEALDSAVFHTPGGWVSLLLLAVLVVALLVALRLRLGALDTVGRRGGRRLFADRPRTAAEHRATAAEHAAAGHWNPAVQEQMRALVRSLEERTLLQERPGRTADEAADEAARPLPALAARLRAAAAVFDAVAYGGRNAAERDYTDLCALDAEARHATPDFAGGPGTGAGGSGTPGAAS